MLVFVEKLMISNFYVDIQYMYQYIRSKRNKYSYFYDSDLYQFKGEKIMRLKIFISLTLLFTCSYLISQNRESFFKVFPANTEPIPKWAQLMYSENPNVFEVDFEYYQYFRSNAFEKNIHVRNYVYWRRCVEEYIDSDGHIDLNLNRMKQPEPENNTQSKNNWTSVGPFETYNLGSEGGFPVSWQANVYCFDQCESNPDILFAGTEAGGVFRSKNKGLSWELVSENVDLTTIDDIKVAPSDSQIVFFTGHDKICKSLDGGDSWTQIYDLGDRGHQLIVHPSNPDIVHCAAHTGFFRSNDGGVTWFNLFTDKCWDVKYHPNDISIMYLLKNNSSLNRCEFYKSIDGGNSWSIKTNGWYMPAVISQASDIGARMATTPISPNIIYVGMIGESKSNDNGWIGVYRSVDAGESWTNPNLPDGGPYNVNLHPNMASFNPDGTGFHQGFFNFAIGVSHNDPSKVFLGCLALSVSTDSAASFTRIGAYYAGNNDIGWIHPDIQDIHVLGNDVWVCSDGGINYSTDDLLTTESRKFGISASDYWGFGQGWNEDVMVGGRYHNGNSGYYSAYGIGNSLRLGGAEAPTGYVSPIEERKAYFSDIHTKSLPETLNGEVISQPSMSMYPNESYYTSYSSEVVFHPVYAHHIYLGKDSKIWKSTNEGASFDLLYSFGLNGRVLELEISRTNPEIMYCVFQDGSGYWDWCRLYKSIDGGANWTMLPTLSTNRWRLEISINPQNENELWVASMDGANGEKVFRTIDGGSTWQNMSTNVLNDDKPRDIQYQAGSNIVYLACSNGVYYFDSVSNNWIDVSSGLPASTKALEMIPFYKEAKLRLATAGRGIWEYDFIEESQISALPMTKTDSVYCTRDTIQFDCNSILNHTGANWQWSFSPTPTYVSSYLVRNPKIVCNSGGSYDVSITITDALGNTSTKTIVGMITVLNNCYSDTIPGLALQCNNTGDFAETGNFGLNTSHMTITAWVKADGIQNDYTGIVINNGTTAGFNFKNNNQLGYHWPDGAWWWNSNLFIPSEEWIHVAMVATPTSITLYVDGIGSTHTTNLSPVDLVTMNIGSYKGWGSRNFSGMIDEVAIWKRALTQDEIRLLRHLTLNDLNISDPDLLAYYQFNELSGQVLDKKGIAHAIMYGGSARVNSGAPVGGGSSYKQICNTGTSYNFTQSGCQITFPQTGTWPDGEVVVTRINLAPGNPPNYFPNLGSYWIINNYGANQQISPLDEILFYPSMGEISPSVSSDPSKAVLFQRADNSDQNSWVQNCNASNAGSGQNSFLGFSNACNITETGQFYITSNDSLINLLGGTVTVVEHNPVDSKNRISLYPNPVSLNNPVYVNYKGKEQLRIKLFNSEGKLTKDIIMKKQAPKEFTISGIAKGIYFYMIEGESFIERGKITIE